MEKQPHACARGMDLQRLFIAQLSFCCGSFFWCLASFLKENEFFMKLVQKYKKGKIVKST